MCRGYRRSPSRQFSVLFLLLGLVLGGRAVSAVPVDLPESVPIIDAERLIELAQTYADLLLIDSRIRSDRLQGYIEGAVSLPDTKTTCRSLAEVTTSRDQPLIFYCNGTDCDRSGKAVTIAHHCRFKNIYWFRGGFKEWKAKRYPYIK